MGDSVLVKTIQNILKESAKNEYWTEVPLGHNQDLNDYYREFVYVAKCEGELFALPSLKLVYLIEQELKDL